MIFFQDSPNDMVPVIFFLITVLMIHGIRDLDNPVGGLITPHYEDLINIWKLIENGYQNRKLDGCSKKSLGMFVIVRSEHSFNTLLQVS